MKTWELKQTQMFGSIHRINNITPTIEKLKPFKMIVHRSNLLKVIIKLKKRKKEIVIYVKFNEFF